jgi:hypothetical protein
MEWLRAHQEEKNQPKIVSAAENANTKIVTTVTALVLKVFNLIISSLSLDFSC